MKITISNSKLRSVFYSQNRLALFLSLMFTSGLSHVHSQTPAFDGNWNPILVFEDQFNAPSLNNSIWVKFQTNEVTGEAIWQWQNGKYREYFSSSNAYLENGKLKLLAQYDPNNLPYSDPLQYRVGGIRTTRDFNYGFYEFSVKLPSDQLGRWISLWLIGGGNNDEYYEFDILENLDVTDNFSLEGAIHQRGLLPDGTYGTFLPDGYRKIEATSNQNLSSSFNKIAMEWLPGILIFYLNDIPFYEFLYQPIVRDDLGTWDNIFMTGGISDVVNPNIANLPNTTEIDYVKVSELKLNMNSVVFSNYSQIQPYNYGLETIIQFLSNNLGNSIYIPPGQNHTFRATNLINIDTDFTVPLGAELTLFTHDAP